jgi:hypothetical protein
MSAATAGAIGTGLTVLSGVTSVLGGLQGMAQGNQQADAARATAAMQAREQVRVSAREAEMERQNVEDTVRRQKLAYMSSGVSLEGSPLLVMEETRRRGADNIEEIIQGGAYGAASAKTEGRLRAQQAKSSGRQAFVSGIMGAGTALSRLA